MNTDTHPDVPTWVWFAAGAAAVGGLVGAIIWAARAPSYDRLLARTGAPAELGILAALQRYTESHGNPKAGLGRPELFPSWTEPRNALREEQLAESDAAAAAYDRNREAYIESPYPRRMWIFGSGGPYGLIPANALAPWRGTDTLRRGKVTPYDVFNPWRATVFFVDYVKRLIDRAEFRNLPAGSRNVLALKRGLASPTLVADYEELKARSRTVRRKAAEAAQALGLDEDLLYTKIPLSWPDYPGATRLIS
ncbi:MAG TPA: hypothetical protein VK034_11600 [Enhygromyxa sp.]|nr:hypothetical protein [Enhygromyxa sp.]